MMASGGASALVAGRDGAPALVLLGAPRCGTTSLAKWLGDAGLGVGVKDSFYLMDDDAGLRGSTHVSGDGVDGYLNLFRGQPDPAVEVTAGYLYQQRALAFFASWRVPPQFAVILRDPIERLESVHQYFTGNLMKLPSDLTFDDYISQLFDHRIGLPDQTVSNALVQGRYAEALDPWAERFGKERIRILRFEDIKAHPAEVVTDIVSALGQTSAVDLRNYHFASRNQSYSPRNRAVKIVSMAGRHLVPRGRIRSAGGELWRRLQVGRGAAPQQHRVASEAVERVRAYYVGPNHDLAHRYGIDVSGWTTGAPAPGQPDAPNSSTG
ncbi:MAG: sulfotransferase domain-containing protein [Tetrasphaera sp.]|jgi:hypothetical protein|nr:sulfotransferase domain-containing protein [Tetrasphaera sp.]